MVGRNRSDFFIADSEAIMEIAPAVSAAAVPDIGALGNDSRAAIKTAAKTDNGKMNIKKDERIESPVGSKILTAQQNTVFFNGNHKGGRQHSSSSFAVSATVTGRRRISAERQRFPSTSNRTP